METLSFTFGILTMVAIIIVVAAVIGVVKVVKQQSQIKDLQDINNHLSDYNGRRFDELEHHISGIADTINQRIDKENEQIYRNIRDTHSYIDSRIDKLEAKKQLIKS